MSVRDCLDWVNVSGKIAIVGSPIPYMCVLDFIGIEVRLSMSKNVYNQSLSAFTVMWLAASSSCLVSPQWWTATWNCKQNKPFLCHAMSWYFVTHLKRKTRTLSSRIMALPWELRILILHLIGICTDGRISPFVLHFIKLQQGVMEMKTSLFVLYIFLFHKNHVI